MRRLVIVSSLYALLALLLAVVSMVGNAQNDQILDRPFHRPNGIYDVSFPRRPPLGRDLLPPLPVQIVTSDPNTSPSYASVKQALSSTDESEKLRGLLLKDWYGWITSDAQVGTTNTIAVVIGNPFTEDSTFNAVLQGSQKQLQNLRLGQIVKFSGAIDNARAYYFGLTPLIQVGNADIQAVPETGPDISNQPVPASLELTLERTVCFGRCPAYKLKIRGDGTVIFQDAEAQEVPLLTVPMTGPVQTSTISRDKVAELLAMFRKVDYVSLKDSYENDGLSDMPSAYTSITIDGKSKAVAHYHGDPSAPVKLTLLEDLIDEIVNTRQWLKEKDNLGRM